MEIQIFNGKYHTPEAIDLIRSICNVAIQHHERMIQRASEEDTQMRERSISYLQNIMHEAMKISKQEKETLLQTTLKLEV